MYRESVENQPQMYRESVENWPQMYRESVENWPQMYRESASNVQRIGLKCMYVDRQVRLIRCAINPWFLVYFRYKAVEKLAESGNGTEMAVNVTRLWETKTFALTVTWAHNLLRSIIPLIILCVLNMFIIQALRRTRSTKKKLTSRNRITLTLISVIIVFLVCVTPDAVMSTFFGYGYAEADYLVRGVREITDLLLAVNSSVNFILYCTFNKMFRKQFMLLFCARCKSCALQPVQSNFEHEETCVRRSSFTAAIRNSMNGNTRRCDEPLCENDALQTSLW